MAEQSLFIIEGIHFNEGFEVLAVRSSEEEARELVEELRKYNNPLEEISKNKKYEYKHIPGCPYHYSYDSIIYEEVEDNYFVKCLVVRNISKD